MELGGGQAEHQAVIKANVATLLNGSFLLGPADADVSENAPKFNMLTLDGRANQATLRTLH